MILILSASPNTDGLTAHCVATAAEGIQAAGTAVEHLNLCTLALAHCRQCGNGWGTCRPDHVCCQQDTLGRLQQAIAAADGLVLVSPVYYGELAESAKAAFDRLRRCEFTRRDAGILTGKPVLAIAAAGGSGGGTQTCLASMERFIQHTYARVADLIGVTQRNRAYQLPAIRAAATTLVTSLTPIG